MNSEAALTETWIVWIFNPGATIIRSSSCYESDSRYTKHYQQFWRYHNHISGLMPLTNSYLTTILVHMLWHSGELHILAPLALLFYVKLLSELPESMLAISLTTGNKLHIKIRIFSFQKMPLIMLSAKYWSFCSSLSVLLHHHSHRITGKMN